MSEMILPPEDRETKRQLPKLLDARRRLLKGNDLTSRHGPGIEEQTPGAGKSGALRAAVFGINDGLLTNAALIMGFAGANAEPQPHRARGHLRPAGGRVLDGRR